MSEPVFEASVRLRADVGDFEQQAQASIKNTLDRLERQTSEAVRTAQQRISQATVPGAAAPTGGAGAITVPVEVEPVAPQVEANIAAGQAAAAARPVEIQTKTEPPKPVTVPVEVAPVAPQVEAAIGEAQRRAAAQPIRMPVEVAPAAPFAPVAPTPQLDQMTQAIERARALAAQPIELNLVANTAPFERQVNVAFKQALELAEQNAAQLSEVETQAAAAASKAVDTLAKTRGFEARAEAQAALDLAQQAARTARTASEEAQLTVQRLRNEAQGALLAPSEQFLSQAEIAGTRADTAKLLGDQAEQEKQLFNQEIAGRQFALEQLQITQANLAQDIARLTGSDREAAIAAAENAAAQSAVLRRQLAELQSAGRLPPTVPPGEDGGRRGFFDTLTGPGGLLRSRSGSSSLAGILGTTARFGLAGFAFSAAFSTLNELQQSLRVTGREAYTAEGRIRNLGSELLSGNLIGGIRALTAARPAEIIGELGDEVTAAIEKQKAATDPLIVSTEKLALVHQQGEAAVNQYILTLVEGGHVTLAQAAALLEINSKMDAQKRLVEATADAWANYNTKVEQAGGLVTSAFGPDSAGGPRGPGAFTPTPTSAPAGTVIGQQRTGIPQPIIAVGPNPAFQAGSGGPEVAAQIRESINSRIRDEQELAAARLREARIQQKTAQESFNIAKENVQHGAAAVNSAADEYLKLVQANTRLADATQNVKDTAVAAAAAAQELSNQVADSAAAAIADPAARAQAELTNARAREAQQYKEYQQAIKDSGRGSAEANKQLKEYQIAVNQRRAIENQIAYESKQNAQQAAEAAAADAKSAHEQRLANNIAAAARTAGKADDKRFYNEAIAYYRELSRDSSVTATERERARGMVSELRAGLKSALQDDGSAAALQQQLLQNALARAQASGNAQLQRRAAQHLIDFWEGQVKSLSGIERAQAQASLIAARGTLRSVNRSAEQASAQLAQQRIENRVQAARLTEGLGDDKRAADALIRFWQNQVAHAQGLEKERARSNLIAARLARQSLDQSEKATTTVFDLLTRTAARFSEFSGNLIDKNNPFTRESFVGEQAQFFKPGVRPGDIFAGPTGFTADLNAFRERQERLGRIPGAGVEATDRNTDALNRLTDTLTGRVPGIERGDLGRSPTARRLTPGETAGLRGQAMSEFWKARQARLAAEAGVGAAGAGF